MDTKQNHAAPLERLAALDRNLPEIFVERQQHPSICFSDIEQSAVSSAGSVGPHPEYVVARQSQCLHSRQREVLIREKMHQTGRG